jgi:hypothetical protein
VLSLLSFNNLLLNLTFLFYRPSNTSNISFVSRSHILYDLIAYRGPSIEFVSPLSLSSIGGTELTVDGSDFGLQFSSPVSIFVCSQPCMRVSFVSSTSVTCNAPPAPQGNYKLLAPVADTYCPVTISVANQNGTYEGNVTFFRPPLSLQSVSPQIAGSGMIVTVIGSAFGLENPNPVVRFGSTACTATLWQSWTQLLCFISQGSGKALNVSMTIFDRAVLIFSAFSYPPPEILSIFPLSIPSLGAIITITGSNFGTNQSRIVVYTNESPCLSPFLIKSNTITCLAAAGSGVNRKVSVSSDEQSSSIGMLSYDPPSLDSVHPALMPANLGFKVTLTGTSLGFTASSFMLLNFSAEIWPYPILSECSSLSPHFTLLCSISTSSIPSEMTEKGAVNSSVLVSVDAQASAALPVAILPRSSLAQLIINFNDQFLPGLFSDKLIGVLAAPPTCAIFIRNVSASIDNRRLLSNSAAIDLFLISHRSVSEAQKLMDDLGAMWSSNPKPLQAIGVIGASFENVVPLLSPPRTSSPVASEETNAYKLPDWFVPTISVIFGSIVFGIITFLVIRCHRARTSPSSDKTTSSTDSESTHVENEDNLEIEESFISVQIDGNLNSAAEATLPDADDAVVNSIVRQRDSENQTNMKSYGVSIDKLVTREYLGYSVPVIAATLMDFVLSMGGQKTQGIFRLSASAKETAAARRQIEVFF